MDPWAVLGVPPGSSDRAIRAAYLRLSRIRHPDMGGSDGAMQELNAAYEAALRFVAAPVTAPPPPPREPFVAPAAPRPAPPPRPARPKRPFYKKKRYYVAAVLAVALIGFTGISEEAPPRRPKDEIYKLIGRCVLLVDREINAVVPCNHPHDAWVVDVQRLPEFCPPLADDHLLVENYLICLNREK